MNYLWGSMILIGIIYGTVTGHLEEVSEAAIQSSKEAVSLCVVMAGVTALWVGMMRIAEKSGLLEAVEQRMQPVLNFLFPEIPGNHPSRKSIATNLLANVLGLGWAATPAGLKVNIIAFRTEYGSVTPTAIVGPAILATAISTGAAVLYIKTKNWMARPEKANNIFTKMVLKNEKASHIMGESK